jgi:hypothetical protein
MHSARRWQLCCQAPQACSSCNTRTQLQAGCFRRNDMPRNIPSWKAFSSDMDLRKVDQAAAHKWARHGRQSEALRCQCRCNDAFLRHEDLLMDS